MALRRGKFVYFRENSNGDFNNVVLYRVFQFYTKGYLKQSEHN